VSTQLEKLGKLSDSNMQACVHALGGTLAYSIDFNNLDSSMYDLELLTVATHLDDSTQMIDTYLKNNPQHKCEINRCVGIAGHTIIHFKNRGKILTSSSHWIELDNFSVDDKKVEEG